MLRTLTRAFALLVLGALAGTLYAAGCVPTPAEAALVTLPVACWHARIVTVLDSSQAVVAVALGPRAERDATGQFNLNDPPPFGLWCQLLPDQRSAP